MITLKRSRADDPNFQILVDALDKDLWARYPAIQQNFTPFNKIDATACVVVAYDESYPVGCGCFRPMDGEHAIEIKRMYVKPESRGLGIAKLILSELEEWGKEEGFTQVKLETGNNQPEALAVYTRAQYEIIPNYPPYTHIAESICMSKRLV
ncbi:MAG TPA: GNAT family N-acetyltransferase [Chryseolinea sp.]|nr:GNAT family N-acetyltransferase [Chryseolinea sp.]